jgi:hypothetical protein
VIVNMIDIDGNRERLAWADDRPLAPITVAVPTHPARGNASDPNTLLGRAVASVYAQTLAPAGGLSIACDLNGDGAAVTRQRALDAVETEFVSFLDSDDYLYPQHLETHWRLLTAVGEGAELDDIAGLAPLADVAYSWWGGNRPFPEATHRGLVFDNTRPHHITMTLTVRTELAKRVGFISDPLNPEWYGEDWRMITGLAALGARFVGTGEETWYYDSFHGGNTSGHPHRGDGPSTC